MSIQQRSQLKGFGQSTNEKYIVLDINEIITELNTGGNQQVLGTSIWANGFTIVGAITEDITLPAGATVNYTGPLSMSGTLTVPTGTTLNIL
tara:strand:- start:544 stop:819 length:276 start_codon:yes stop_codon:yes gene_type:complete